jgi:uncharacterized protein (TIGR03435 family)
MRLGRLLMTMAAALVPAAAQPQSLAAPEPAFDAASIKPAKPGTRGYSIRPLPGRVSAENVTLKLLIAEAYHISDRQISGGPKWIDAERYDIEAKAAGDVPPTTYQLRAMLQKLLLDRFALALRREAQEMPVYVLRAGKGGPKFRPAAHPEAPVMFHVFQRRQITAGNAPLENLTEALAWLLGKPVLDRTGLEGSFDYKLDWTPDEVQLQSPEAPPQADGTAPSLAGALLQQMGLRITSEKAPVEVLVVERAEKPIGN